MQNPPADEEEWLEEEGAGPQIYKTRINYTRPWLYPLQEQAIFDPARICCIEASTKAGKTVGCIAWLVEQAYAHPGPGKNFWWVAPVTSQSDIAFTRTIAFLNPGTFNAIRGGQKRIIIGNGNILWFKGGDRPDTLYGDDVHAAVIDEASRTKEDAWHAVRSTLTYTRGAVRIIGNVRGRRNWAYQLARRAEKGDDPELAFHRLIAYDAVQAGVLEQSEIRAAQQTLPEHVFEELYLARASDDGGNPFGLQHIRDCVIPSMVPGKAVCWGIDLAKSIDYTVLIALDAGRNVCAFHRWQRPWEETISDIARIVRNTPALVDSTGVGDPVLERLQRTLPGTRFMGYHFTPASKQKLMEGLAVVIQSKGITIPEGPIVSELEQFEFEVTRTGVRYAAMEGFHDDCVCALALAVEHHHVGPRPLHISQATLMRAAMMRPNILGRI